MPRDFLSDDSESPQMEKLPGRDFLAEDNAPQKESLGTSAALAIPRVGEDLIKGAYHALQSVPSYYEKAKTEVPGVLNTLQQHPGHALGQGVAGLAELGQNVFNMPHDIANYATNRLHLIPEDVNQKIQMARMPDSEQDINATFGEPQYAGESLIRGAGRNALNLMGAGKLATTLNPMNLTAKNIAKDILNTGETNKKMYGELYKNLWNEANQKGFGDALYNVDIDIPTLKKFSPAKGIKGVLDFDNNPTLENAHAAKSDLLRIQRDLNKLPTLRSAERQQLKAATDAINNIQGNMFKDASGAVDQNMLDKYNKIQQGYASDVIPYKNKAINKFKRNEMSANELVNSLSRGEFAAKRGSYHPEMGVRNAFKNHPYLTGAGAAGLGKMLYDSMMGNQPSQH